MKTDAALDLYKRIINALSSRAVPSTVLGDVNTLFTAIQNKNEILQEIAEMSPDEAEKYAAKNAKAALEDK